MWRKYLCEKLELRKHHKKIIIDEIGITENRDFIEFLKKNSIEFESVSNESSLIAAKRVNIFITAKLSIPMFIKSKTEIYDIEDILPFELSLSLIKKYPKEKICSVVAYNLDTLKYTLIEENNFEKILKEADLYFINKKNKFLKKNIEQKLNQIKNYDDVLSVAKMYGELVYNSCLLDEDIDNEFVEAVDNVTFDTILNKDVYKNAFYASLKDFKTINKVIPYIKQTIQDKFALVCFDGMGIPEWNFLKQFLKNFNVSIKERYIFALIPTITQISRSSLFSGEIKKCYKERVNETFEFKNKFQDLYVKSFFEGEINKNSLIGVDAVKIIYNLFDDNAHNYIVPPNKKNKNGYFKFIESYIKNSTIKKEMAMLLNSGYKIFISSDHGCVVSKGIACKIDKYLIESGSKRAAIVEESSLLKQYEDKFFVFNPPFSNSSVIIPKDRLAFHNKGKHIITHGGITLEELVVPFVEIEGW